MPMLMSKAVSKFFSQLHEQPWVMDVFDNLPDILFYIKDANSRWITCNQASLRLLNFASVAEVYGAVEHDFFPKIIADAIRADDLDVIRNNRKIINRTELIVDEGGLLTWVSTSKTPLMGKNNCVAGLVGTTQVLRRLDDLPQAYQPFQAVMQHIQDSIDSTINISDLSRVACLSESQFRKRFRALFRLSPQEFILRARLQRAAKLLSSTDMPLVHIALKCGYCDQSYFTKQFRGFFGMPPRRYRQVWQSSGDER